MVLATSAPAWQADSNGHEKNNNKENDIILKLRSLVKAEKNLVCSTTDDFLLRFIKASQYDLKQSHILVKEYFKAKFDNPDAFLVQSPTEHVPLLSRLDLGYPLKEFDHGGRQILYTRLGDVDPAKECWISIVQGMIMTLEAYSFEDHVQDKGLSLILDATNFTLKLMKWATPNKMRILMRLLQECIPVRFEAIHIVNAPLVFNIFFTALKPFMNEEFKKKLNWHRGDCKSIEDHMDRHILPPSLGGSLDTDEIKYWYQIVVKRENDFAEIRKMGYKSAVNGY